MNEEYLALNEELMQSNEQLFNAKSVIEERENLLTQITDNVPEFISLINNDFEYEFANNGYARAFRSDKEEIRGQKVNNILDKETYDKAFPFFSTVVGRRKRIVRKLATISRWTRTHYPHKL